ncbi:hypothetical protein HY991_04105 [Candidatus Micrarchaeota archaeon]|nr:hypothetical protein [Candidatus Micrarchaeota archaeon]
MNTIKVTALIRNWVLGDCGEVRIRQRLSNVQLYARPRQLQRSNEMLKKLTYLIKNRYSYVGRIDGKLVSKDTSRILALIVDCGVPIRIHQDNNIVPLEVPIGSRISGKLDLFLYTCVDDVDIRKTVDVVVKKIELIDTRASDDVELKTVPFVGPTVPHNKEVLVTLEIIKINAMEDLTRTDAFRVIT